MPRAIAAVKHGAVAEFFKFHRAIKSEPKIFAAYVITPDRMLIIHGTLFSVAKDADGILCAVEGACETVLYLKALKHRHRRRSSGYGVKAVPKDVANNVCAKAARLRTTGNRAAEHRNRSGREVFDDVLKAVYALIAHRLFGDSIYLIRHVQSALARQNAVLHVFAQKALVDTAVTDIITDAIYLDGF